MKLCAKCNERERVANAYCRPCKNEVDLKSYHRNQEKRRQYQQAYFESNPDKLEKGRAQTKKWLKENKGYMNEWMKDRRDTDPNFKLNHYIGSRLHSSLKGIQKNQTLTRYLGCSILSLHQHLENQFTEGMSWDNYGKWHVDHIRPIASFDFTDESQIEECWHYTNLQPLWAIDNLKKSSKYDS
jgi:hypothetical protein